MAAYYVLNWMRSGQTLGHARLAPARRQRRRAGRLKFAPAVLRFCFAASRRGAPAALGVLWLYVDPDTWRCTTGCRAPGWWYLAGS